MKKSTKRKIYKKAKSLSLALLEFLSEAYELTPGLLEGKYGHMTRLRQQVFGGYQPRQINQVLYRLKKQGLVRRQKVKNHFVYPLTLEGYQKLLIERIKEEKYNPKDGTSCIVMFDIPEEKAKHRRFVRALLMKNGFMNIQRSVMIGPNFLPKQFYELMEDLKIRQNVTIIKGKILYSL